MPISKGASLATWLAMLAIVAVMAAFAIPAWRSHHIVGRLDEALNAGEAAKLVVLEAAAMRGGLASIKPNDLNYNPGSTFSLYTASVNISESGRITLMTRDTGATPDPVFLLTPLEDVKDKASPPLVWSCDMIKGDPQWMPPNCVKQENQPYSNGPVHPSSG